MDYQETLKVLRVEATQRRRGTKRLRIFFSIALGIHALLLLLLILQGKETLGNAAIAFFPVAVLLGGISMGMTPQGKSALLTMAQSGNPEIVGLLIESMDCGDAAVVDAARNALKSLLPDLGQGAVPLDQVQFRVLVERLPQESEDLAALFVESLAKIGRPESIPVLESLAAEQPSPYLRRDSKAIRAAAKKALPELRIRLASEIIRKKLQEVDALRERLGASRELSSQTQSQTVLEE
ncbi:MAG: hypothetical protein JNM28_04135 [Armatimonadetes bacterium]|nr:hypothetical protein [Armatimonadota bacterium]